MDSMDALLANISEISSGNLGSLCISHQYRSVPVPLAVHGSAFDSARQKTDLVARIVLDIGHLEDQGTLRPSCELVSVHLSTV